MFHGGGCEDTTAKLGDNPTTVADGPAAGSWGELTNNWIVMDW